MVPPHNENEEKNDMKKGGKEVEYWI